MDDPVCRTSTSWFHLLTILFRAEIHGEEEEHRQLPLDENVPQGRRSSQEGRCPRLKQYSRIVRRLITEASYPGVWGSFDIIFRENSGPYHVPWSGSVSLHQAMGVGLLLLCTVYKFGYGTTFQNNLIFILVMSPFGLIRT